MKALLLTTGVWLLLAAVGAGLYLAYTRLVPRNILEVMSGWKTKTFGIIVALSPDAIQLLSLMQVLGSSWEPSETVTWVMRGLGMTITVLRFISDHENEHL